MSYKDTSLWKRTLGKRDKNVEPLRESYLDARQNAKFLLDKIRNDFPNLTVHDITHVDSLWNVADVIIGDKYDINPLEGYSLGIAFLIHDAALSYDAVGGKDKLRDTIEWKDAYADVPGDMDEEDFKKECDFAAIRALHAKYAEDILNKRFERDNATTFYIIDNDEYRIQFGDRIGKIAASHHWSIDEVESKLDIQINPVAGFPNDWEINEQKLACILRCADAGHIDNGRAPFGIYNSLIVNGVSRYHWESQTRLGQVRENRKNPEQLLITSTRSFTKDNFAAWNVAYDAVRLFDEELKKSNELLKSEGLSFPHIGITGAESKEALSEYIKTDGWQPCIFGVHTSNVKVLIENLGGSKLYGEENMLFVALRELIQNARDAIQARRTMDGRPEEGQITIRLKEEEGKRWIEVEDDGIGMSLNCIKYNLLDFGSSYWKSNLAKYENPGLRSKGFKSIGKFGIGFYSVFMVAESVEVVTKRYDKGADDAWRIEFPSGLTLSPILSPANLNANISTVVKFDLKEKTDLKFTINDEIKSVSFQQMLQMLVAGLNINVNFEDNDECSRIHTNVNSSGFDKEYWLRGIFINCSKNIGELATKLEEFKDENGNLIGLILSPDYMSKIQYNSNTTKELEHNYPCIHTIGGLLTTLDSVYDTSHTDHCYMGYMDGEEDCLSRNKMVFDKSLKKRLEFWFKQKYRENYDNLLSMEETMSSYFCDMIVFFRMEKEIIQENVYLLYTNYRNLEVAGTYYSLFEIDNRIFSGVIEKRDRRDLLYYLGLKGLFNLPNNKYRRLFLERIVNEKGIIVKKSFEELFRINDLPATNYDIIIQKYLSFNYYYFYKKADRVIDYYEDKLTLALELSLKVWINIMIDRLLHQMIDWRKVHYDDLYLIHDKYKKHNEQFTLISKRYIEDYGYCLKKHLIPTEHYLSQIAVTLKNKNL